MQRPVRVGAPGGVKNLAGGRSCTAGVYTSGTRTLSDLVPPLASGYVEAGDSVWVYDGEIADWVLVTVQSVNVAGNSLVLTVDPIGWDSERCRCGYCARRPGHGGCGG